MSDVYRLIHPLKYINNFLSRDLRPDGRCFQEHRSVKLNVGCLRTADSSAVVKCGDTTVICGIQLELAPPKTEEPDMGYLVINVETLPLSSSKAKPGPPSDHAQVLNKVVSDIIQNAKCIDLKDLCISPDKLVWVVHCDIAIINNDGSAVDASVIALVASLKFLTLPSITYDPETEEINVDADNRTPIKVTGLPVATSFCIMENYQRNVLLTDPTAYEEEMCGGVGANLVICWNKGLLSGIQKFGGKNLTPECHKEAMQIAKRRSEVIENIIETCSCQNN